MAAAQRSATSRVLQELSTKLDHLLSLVRDSLARIVFSSSDFHTIRAMPGRPSIRSSRPAPGEEPAANVDRDPIVVEDPSPDLEHQFGTGIRWMQGGEILGQHDRVPGIPSGVFCGVFWP
jgi:hypothetical protein